jgi:hypothetical protein
MAGRPAGQKYSMHTLFGAFVQVMGEDREDIIRIYQFWKFICTRNSAQVHEIIVDKNATKASVQFTQVVENYMHGPSFDLVMNIIFYFEDAPHGKVICKQVY